MSDHTTPLEVQFRRFDRDYSNEAIGFRCYRSSPDSATIQLRGDKQYATVMWVSPLQLDKLIGDLEMVRAEFTSEGKRHE